MPIELECKLPVPSHDPVRAKLRELGATCLGRVLETNRLLDRADGSLRDAGCGLRVRSVVSLDGHQPAATLTFKGPRLDGAFKQRDELETPVGDADAVVGILRILGFTRTFEFEKTRESWQWHGLKIELDELPRLGSFVEVEGHDEAAVRSAVEQLGLDPAASINESYVALLARDVAGQGRGDVVIRFEQPD